MTLKEGAVSAHLNVVLMRTNGERTTHGHIVSDDDRHYAWCGAEVPQFIIDDWDTRHNVYVNKGKVSCQPCIDAWHDGRPVEHAVHGLQDADLSG